MWMWAAVALGGAAEHVGEPRGDVLVWTSTFHRDAGEPCVQLHVQSIGSEVCGPGSGPLEVETEQSFPANVIAPPLAADGLQRIRVSHARLEPEGIDKNATSWSTSGVTLRERRGLDQRLDRRLRPRVGVLYVDPARVPSSGVPGRVLEARASTAVRVGAGLIFLGLCGLLWALYRLLEHAARRERVDAWMEDPEVDDELRQAGVR